MYIVWVQTKPWKIESFRINEVALEGFIARQKAMGRRIDKIEYAGYGYGY